MISIPEKKLRQLTHRIVRAFGCPDDEAGIVSNHLVDANLAGHDSHGVGMLPMYGAQVADGNLLPDRTVRLVTDNGAVLVVDGQRGFGHHMAIQALDLALPRAEQHGVAVLGLHNSGHVSRTGHYAEYCANRGYASVHFVNVLGPAPLVAPFGGRQAAFSTNPVSMAMPLGGQARPMLDMATSKVAFGKVRVANNKGERVPEGCLIDEAGRPTTDPGPMATTRRGALCAFGDHKGSGLAVFAELFASALLGQQTVASAATIPEGAYNGMLSIIMNPSAFGDTALIEQYTREFCNYISDIPPADGTDKVLLPGEPEAISRQQRGSHGIPLDANTLGDIIQTGVSFGLNSDQLKAMTESSR